jgi:predicted GIY-YIG superfamily endonuclease
MFSVYLVYSAIVGRKYIGHTEDIKERINEHNNHLLGVYTKNKGAMLVSLF